MDLPSWWPLHDQHLGMQTTIKALRYAYLLPESMKASFDILERLGEKIPVTMNDNNLVKDMQMMNETLRDMPDELILGMAELTDKRTITLLKIYSNLIDVLYFIKPALICSISVRMIQLMLDKKALCAVSPEAFSSYGEVLASHFGLIPEACRLGKCAYMSCFV